MKECWNCHAMIEDEANFCSYCRAKQEKKPEPIQEPKETVNRELIKVQIEACKTREEVQEILKNPAIANEKELLECIERKLKKIEDYEMMEREQRVKQERNPYQNPSQNPVQNPYQYNPNMIELDTWIQAGKSVKSLYENSANPKIEKNEFMNKVSKKLRDNNVPVKLRETIVNWDRGKDQTSEVVVEVQDSTLKNPFSILLQFIKIGKFSFVGNNMFIKPPVLPVVPGEPKEVPTDSGVLAILIGCILLVFGASLSNSFTGGDMSAPFIILGLVIGGIGGFIEYRKKQIKDYNKKCLEELIAWNKAWADWEEQYVDYVFEQRVNGKLECICSAVMKSVQQVCQEIYPSGPVMEDQSDVSQRELEEAIAKRRKAVQ